MQEILAFDLPVAGSVPPVISVLGLGAEHCVHLCLCLSASLMGFSLLAYFDCVVGIFTHSCDFDEVLLTAETLPRQV